VNDHLYRLLTSVVDLLLWRGDLIGEENLPLQGPAVLIGNHSDAAGPIAAACSLPMPFHPWAISYMMDKGLAPGWLQADFTERQLHLTPPLSRWLAQALCRFVVPLFHSLGCIPVAAGDYQRMEETLRLSMDVLRRGEFVFIFPEDYRLPRDPVTGMQPFQHSFVRLAEEYYRETRQRLSFIPMAAHSAGYLMIGKPVVHDPLNPAGTERRRLKNTLEQTTIRMWLELDAKGKGGEAAELAAAKR
jgi:1-acyl-sn-glycerol-3-phosphate acyltransferase